MCAAWPIRRVAQWSAPAFLGRECDRVIVEFMFAVPGVHVCVQAIAGWLAVWCRFDVRVRVQAFFLKQLCVARTHKCIHTHMHTRVLVFSGTDGVRKLFQVGVNVIFWRNDAAFRELFAACVCAWSVYDGAVRRCL